MTENFTNYGKEITRKQITEQQIQRHITLKGRNVFFFKCTTNLFKTTSQKFADNSRLRNCIKIYFFFTKFFRFFSGVCLKKILIQWCSVMLDTQGKINIALLKFLFEYVL